MKPLALIVLIVFVDLIGFTLVMPLLPRFAGDYGFTPWQIGAVLAAFPFCQLFAAPILGRLSDRYGRRPVLVVSQACTAISFLIMGMTRDFWILLLARALDGASGGNILVAQAYVADITKPEDRSKSLGILGAAFGVGFVLGPLLGGALVALPIGPDWRLRLPFFVAAGFSTAAWLLVWRFLPETLTAEARALKAKAPAPRWAFFRTITTPPTSWLIVVGTLLTLSFAAFEGTFSLYMKERLDWGPARASWGFAFIGFLYAGVQAGLVRRLVPRYGELRLIVLGGLGLAAGMAVLALAHDLSAFLVASALIALGLGVAAPSASGLLSRSVSAHDQGSVFGVYSSTQTLARLVNYLVANVLLGTNGSSAPYWEAAAIAAGAALIALATIRPANRGIDE